MSALATYSYVIAVTRTVLLFAAFGVAGICAFDWAVRTRRINPFSRTARFFRGRIEPMMAPVERVVVRSGGVPSTAPWWALAAVVVGGILALGGIAIAVISFGIDRSRARRGFVTGSVPAQRPAPVPTD